MRRFIRILDDRIIKTSEFYGIGFIITIRRLLTQEMKHMRWGKKFEDKRDWKEYNETLVRRGELYLSLGFLDSWDNELAKMNAGKRGAPFSYPDQFVAFMGFIVPNITHLTKI